ncbi:MAG TPA: DNA primase [Bacilli bacterium]|nr:DNA primase [Bacilli bacterium]
MSYIDQEEINKIRSSVDIIDIVGSYIPLTKKGKNYFGVCPFHDDHTPSMSVSGEKQIYKCFTCGASGNVFTFVQDYENVSFIEAVGIVANKAGITLSQTISKPKKDTKYQKCYEVMDMASKYYQNNLRTKNGLEAKKYLLNRGFSEEVIDDFQIGLSLDTKDGLKSILIKKGYPPKVLFDLGLISKATSDSFDQLSGRIIIPLHDINGNVIGFTGRIYRNEKTPKYINTKETVIFKKGDNLYNYFLAKEFVKQAKNIILVEGQMDAIRLYSEGFKNVVATGGTSLTKEQIGLLKKLKAKIILCLDNDNPGLEATYKLGEVLEKNNLEVYVIRLSKAKDPDEYIKLFGKEAFQDNLNNLVKYFDFKLMYLKNNKDLANSVDLSNYINEVLDTLKNEKDEILREITINKLSKDYDIDIEILKSKLGEMAKIKVESKPVTKKEPTIRKDKYQKASERLIFYMMNSPTYIKMYKRQLGFVPFTNYRNIINEILYFYELNKTINEADFISFISSKEEMSKMVLRIVNENDDETFLDDEMTLYINIIKEYMCKERIAKLKEELKKEMDINKKVEILTKIANIKKEEEK